MKLLIVDDERAVRDGLHLRLHQFFGDILDIRDAVSGVSALSFIKEWNPELVLTDVCMSDMSGLELMQKVKEIRNATNFIIISGHDDFAYAREALRLGAKDYLLKPIDERALFQSIQPLMDKSEQWDVDKYNPEKIRKYLRQILHIGFDVGQLSQFQGIKFEELFPTNFFRVVVFSGSLDSNSSVVNMPLHFPMNGNDAYYYILEERSGLCCCIVSSSQMQGRLPNAFFDSLSRTAISEFSDCTYGISSVKKKKDIPLAFHEAFSCAYTRIYGNTGFVYQEEVSFAPMVAFETNAYSDGLKRAVLRKDRNKIRSLLQNMFKDAKEMNFNPVDFTEALKDMVFHVQDYIQDDEVILGKKYFLEQIEQFDLFCRQGVGDKIIAPLCESLYSLFASMDNEDKQYSLVVQKILSYVRENINKPISMKEMADYLGKSQNYLSTVFKQDVGSNFNQYVMTQKMRYAKELMREDSELRTYEIAERVGFTDEKYFIRLFKRYWNITPSKMRNSNESLLCKGRLI